MAGLDPLFQSRLSAALSAGEKATGARRVVTDTFRDPRRQAQYYANYSGRTFNYQGQTYSPLKKGGLAAKPPGFEGAPGSRHQRGLAADLGAGPVRDWVRSHAPEFGLETLRGGVDLPHIQLAGGGRSGGNAGSQGVRFQAPETAPPATPAGTVSDVLAQAAGGSPGASGGSGSGSGRESGLGGGGEAGNTGLSGDFSSPRYDLQTQPAPAPDTDPSQMAAGGSLDLSPLAELFTLPAVGGMSASAPGTPLPGALPGQAKQLRRPAITG